MAREHENDRSDGDPSRSARSPAAIAEAAAKWFSLRDAGLSPEQERALERWLAEDARHARALAELDGAWSTFGKPAQSGSADRLLSELAGRRSRRRRMRVTMAAAALVLAFVGAGVARWRADRAGPDAQSRVVVHKPNQQRLTDGSVVTLREGAGIAVAFTELQRRVVLQRGEALFEVHKDPARPFVVVANGVAVRAVGTAFSVQAAHGAVDVLVTEGVVSIGPAAELSQTSPQPPKTGSEPERKAVMVTAGNRVVIEPAASGLPVEPEAVLPAEIDRRLSWRSPRLEFAGMPLAEAVSLLNREAEGRTDMRLRIADVELNAVRVSGVFRTDNLDAFLVLIEAGFGIKVDRAGNVAVLSKAP